MTAVILKRNGVSYPQRLPKSQIKGLIKVP